MRRATRGDTGASNLSDLMSRSCRMKRVPEICSQPSKVGALSAYGGSLPRRSSVPEHVAEKSAEIRQQAQNCRDEEMSEEKAVFQGSWWLFSGFANK